MISLGRLKVLEQIAAGHATAYALSKVCGIYPTAIKKHIRALEKEGVIRVAKHGSRSSIHYAINRAQLMRCFLPQVHTDLQTFFLMLIRIEQKTVAEND